MFMVGKIMKVNLTLIDCLARNFFYSLLYPLYSGFSYLTDINHSFHSDEDDISRWQSQVFAPADEILSTSRLEFRLAGLKPSTLYRIRGKLYLHNLPVEPVSDVYSVRTLDLPTVS